MKDGPFADLILGIEKYFREKLKLENLKFEEVTEKLSNCVLRIDIKDEFRSIELWNIYKDDLFREKQDNFIVDFLTLRPLQGSFKI